MLIFHHSSESPNCLKTRMILTELLVEVDQRDYRLADFRKDPELSARFPNGKLPAIEDGDVVLAESMAIAIYLAEKHKRLIPAARPARALMFQALSLESALLAPVIGGMGIFGELGKPEAERDMARVEKLIPEAHRTARVLGALLGNRAYFAGDLSIADFQLYPGAAKAIERGVFGEVPNNLAAWKRRMDELESVSGSFSEYDAYRRSF